MPQDKFALASSSIHRRASSSKAADQAAKARKPPPEPITPVNARAGVDTRVDAKGEFRGSYEEYKALRLAGKI